MAVLAMVVPVGMTDVVPGLARAMKVTLLSTLQTAGETVSARGSLG